MQIGFSELSSKFFSISNLFSAQQVDDGNTTFVMEKPRETDGFLYYYEGSCICYQDSQPPFFVPEGSLVYMPKNSRYMWEYIPSDDGRCVKKYLLEFTLFNSQTVRANNRKKDFSVTEMTDERICFSDKVMLVTTKFPQVYKRMFLDLTKAFNESNTSVLDVYCRVYEIFRFLSEDCASAGKCINTDVIDEGIKYINDTLCPKKSVRELADMCNVSVAHFERLFKGYAGVSPVEYINNKKILFIKQLLQNTNLTLEQIAEEADYCDSGYLCRVFKKKTGMTTNEYRRLYSERRYTNDDTIY